MSTANRDDPELVTMALVLEALETLGNADAQQRVITWVTVRLGLGGNQFPRGTLVPEIANGKLVNPDDMLSLREGTINTVATKLRVNSCRTLLVAAAAYLSLYKGKERFSRDELVACARQARAWKSAYTAQTSVNIARMCETEELIEKGKGIYDLSEAKLAELGQKLAGSAAQ